MLLEPGQVVGDPGPDDVRVDRLEDELGEAVAAAGAPVALRREEDDRHPARALEAADGRGGLEAVDAWHAHVEQDRGELALEHLAQRLLARSYAVDAGAQVLEQRGQRIEVFRLVVDQQDIHRQIFRLIRVAKIGCSATRRSRLETKASAPASSAAMRSAAESFTDMTTTRQAGWRRRSARATSMPFAPGSSRLTRMRSSCACSASVRASCMLRASRSLSGGKEVRSQSRSALRISSCSSTTSTEGNAVAGSTASGGSGLITLEQAYSTARMLAMPPAAVSQAAETSRVRRSPTENRGQSPIS